MPLGKRADCGEARYAGVEVDYCCDLVETIESTLHQCGFDFIVTPLAHPRYRRKPVQQRPDGTLPPPFTRSDLLLSSTQWSGQVVGRVSPWIDCDSPNRQLAADSAAALRQELEWAAHLSLQAVLLPAVQQPMAAANHARVLNQVMNGLSSMALWQAVPLLALHGEGDGDGAAAHASGGTDASASGAAAPAGGQQWADRASDPWEWWNQLRVLCEFQAKLGVVLEVSASLPSQEEVSRWYGEPVRALVLPTSLFITNRRGYPVLSKRHQQLVTNFMQLSVQVILRGNPHSTPLQPGGALGATHVAPGSKPSEPGAVLITRDGEVACEHPLRPYWDYLSYLYRRQLPMDSEAAMELGYRDYLQAPLQPLQDNLESATYETFERDSAKYNAYEEAVHRALMDRVPAADAERNATVLMVVGAGRGPLVRASLAAAARSGRQLRVYAVEKNQNALVTLQNLVVSEGWQDRVTVVGADMRDWQAPELADILVSELLGSFGDNELSPECLDGAQRFLKPGGLSIPASYTSYLQPIATSKLWNDVKTTRSQSYNDLEHYETPYVVKFHRYTPLGPVLPVFTFAHPNPDDPIDNTRSIDLTFSRAGMPGALCHGFAGYFDTCLYGDVTLSIHPHTHTKDMFSWFPIYFPLRTPLYLPPGEDVRAHMWRCARAHKVWYEWAITAPEASAIHNPNGRSYYVGL